MAENKVRVMIASRKEGKISAERFAEIYKKMFDVVYINDFIKFEDVVKSAEAQNMTHILYFNDEVNLFLARLADDMEGYTLEITVDDLQKVLSQNAYDKL